MCCTGGAYILLKLWILSRMSLVMTLLFPYFREYNTVLPPPKKIISPVFMKCCYSVLTIIFAVRQNVIPFTHLACWLGTALFISGLSWSPWSNKISHKGRYLMAHTTNSHCLGKLQVCLRWCFYRILICLDILLH